MGLSPKKQDSPPKSRTVPQKAGLSPKNLDCPPKSGTLLYLSRRCPRFVLELIPIYHGFCWPYSSALCFHCSVCVMAFGTHAPFGNKQTLSLWLSDYDRTVALSHLNRPRLCCVGFIVVNIRAIVVHVFRGNHRALTTWRYPCLRAFICRDAPHELH